MSYALNVNKNVLAILEYRNISIRQLANKINIPASTLTASLKSKKGLPVDIAIAVCDELGFTVEELSYKAIEELLNLLNTKEFSREQKTANNDLAINEGSENTLNLSKRLEIARKSKGFTQDELAIAIGTSRGVITNIELGRTDTMQPLFINAICNALEINPKWFLDGEGEMNHLDVVKSDSVLSEIYSLSKELTEEEQLFVLDLIKSYKKHNARK